MKAGWVRVECGHNTIDPEGCWCTMRLHVPGGWLYSRRALSDSSDAPTVSVAIAFVPVAEQQRAMGAR